MTRPQQHLQPRKTILGLCSLFLVLACFLSPASAIKFDVMAQHNPPPKCVWNYAMADTLVVITANVQGSKDNKQQVDMTVLDGSSHQNVYQTKRDMKGETRMAITTHADADLGVCFTNTLDKGVPATRAGRYSRSVDLDVDIGADAVDYNAIAKQESLSGLEVEMRRLEGVVKEVVDELTYLKRRETRLRDTNESTLNRVKWFSSMTACVLVVLGLWQIAYLRSYFKSKALID